MCFVGRVAPSPLTHSCCRVSGLCSSSRFHSRFLQTAPKRRGAGTRWEHPGAAASRWLASPYNDARPTTSRNAAQRGTKRQMRSNGWQHLPHPEAHTDSPQGDPLRQSPANRPEGEGPVLCGSVDERRAGEYMAEVRTSSQSERPCAAIEETRTALGGAGGSKDPGQRKVHSLIDKVYAPANLAEAWRHVRDNKGGAGIDGLSIAAFADREEERLAALHRKLRDRSYRPSPVSGLESRSRTAGSESSESPRLRIGWFSKRWFRRWLPSSSPTLPTARSGIGRRIIPRQRRRPHRKAACGKTARAVLAALTERSRLTGARFSPQAHSGHGRVAHPFAGVQARFASARAAVRSAFAAP